MKLSILIPCYNEEMRIKKSVQQIVDHIVREKIKIELLFIDDGSTDRTQTILADICRKLNGHSFIMTKIITNPINRGKGYAVKKGIDQACGKHILICDADLSTPIRELGRLLNYSNENDLIIGSRKQNDAKIIKPQPFYRTLLGKSYSLMSKLILHVNVNDFTCGFKLIKNKPAKEIAKRMTIDRWGYDSELLKIATIYKYKIKEVGIIWRDDRRTKVKIGRDIFISSLDLLKIFVNSLFRKYTKEKLKKTENGVFNIGRGIKNYLKINRVSLIIGLSLFFLTFVLRLPTMLRPFDLSYEYQMAFFGREALAGGGFYATPWYLKPPGEALTYGLLYLLFGSTNWVLSVRLFTALLAGLAAVSIYKLGKLLFGVGTGLTAAIIFTLFFSRSDVFSGALSYAEMLMPFFTISGYYLFFLGRKKKRISFLFLAGLSLGASFLYKQSAVYDFLPLLIFNVIAEFLGYFDKRKTMRSVVISSTLLISGFFLPMAIWAFYIIWIDRFALMLDWMVFKALSYSQFKEMHPEGYIMSILKKTYPVVIMAFLGGILTIFRRKAERLLFILWAVFTAFTFTSSGKFWNYYFIQMFIPLCLLSGIFINDLLSFKRRWLSGIFLSGVALLIINFNLNYYQLIFTRYLPLLKGQISQEQYVYSLSEGEPWRAKLETAEFLKHNSKSGETFLIMETTPAIYVLSDKWPVLKEFLYKQQFFVNQAIGFAFMNSHETYYDNRISLIEKLEVMPPNFIVLTIDSLTDAFAEIKAFPRFFSFVFSNYDLVKEYQNSWVYKLRNEKAKAPKDLVIDYQFAKKYTLISPLSKDKVIIESLGGDPEDLEAVLTNASGVNFSFSPMDIKFLRFDGKDFTGHGSEKPSGTDDLHLSIIKERKTVKMIKIKKGESLWVYPSNGINSVIKVFDEGSSLDLYFEPPGSWEKVTFDITVIYQDDSIGHQSTIVQ